MTLAAGKDNSIRWFTTFHLNLMFSCIEEELRPEVIRRCYWPLLRLARDHGVPLGIEAPGITLEIIDALERPWIAELRRMIEAGQLEFIGSGYSQIIGPLVPAEVNAANLRLGHQVYERLLGLRPEIALVNEQAYSSGLVEHYLDAGYRAIVMEWQNPAHAHPEWDAEWRYLPQIACDQRGRSIPVIWNNSVAFQKFQRCAHGEIESHEYFEYLNDQIGARPRAFSLYGNDAEIFDFRPGREPAPPAPGDRSEWSVIAKIIARLNADARFCAIRPSDVLRLIDRPGAGNRLHLESTFEPVPVKKQGKYNLTRWSVTGRDNLGINSKCWRIFHRLAPCRVARESDWRELCYLWSSDFRTNITERRWRAYYERLAACEAKFASAAAPPRAVAPKAQSESVVDDFTTTRDSRFLTVAGEKISVRLNLRRGLAIDGLWFPEISTLPLVGTLPHGFYDDISLAADFYTGHLTFDIPGKPKVTDLNAVEPRLQCGAGWLDVGAEISTPLGPLRKTVRVFDDGGGVEVEWRPAWRSYPPGSLRLGHVTLNPAAFQRERLIFRAHNGGNAAEIFSFDGGAVDHGAAVSSLVSARCGVGLTAGWVELGDANAIVRMETNLGATALLGMIQYKPVGAGYFYRVSLSAQETDETRNRERQGDGILGWDVINVRISARCAGSGGRSDGQATMRQNLPHERWL